MELLEHTVNRFNGVMIEKEALVHPLPVFTERLHLSLGQWERDGRYLVWLEVPIDCCDVIPVAVKAGFTFHHTGETYLLLVKQLLPNTLVPGFATHYIGIGGVVLNPRQELLVVSERHRMGDRPYYKLPGGALHPREHLAEAVVREVLEETGVQARFEAMVAFRHWHGYRHGKSDIYFVARLSPISETISKQDDEIDECFWMPVADYFSSDMVSQFNREIVRAALESPGMGISWIDGYDDPTSREFFFPTNLAEKHPTLPVKGD